jgi:uncharacterized protein YjiS (DUF1127 family)
MTKSQMAFELPRLSYIDTRWEEPAVQNVQPAARPAHHSGFASWVAAYRNWRANDRALTELTNMSDRELSDIGLSRGDIHRAFDDRFNQDLMSRGRAI